MTFYRADSEAVCLGLVSRLDSEQRRKHKCAGAAGGRHCTRVQWWYEARVVTKLMWVPAWWCQRGARGHQAACSRGRAPEWRCSGSGGRSCQTTAAGTSAALAGCPRPAGSHVLGLAALGSLAVLSSGASTPNPACAKEAPSAAVLPTNPQIAHRQRSSCTVRGEGDPLAGTCAHSCSTGAGSTQPGGAPCCCRQNVLLLGCESCLGAFGAVGCPCPSSARRGSSTSGRHRERRDPAAECHGLVSQAAMVPMSQSLASAGA